MLFALKSACAMTGRTSRHWRSCPDRDFDDCHAGSPLSGRKGV